MVKLTKRKGFNFFRSYYDVYNELESNEDKVAFIDALLDRQFLGVKPDGLKGMAKFAYISQTNSIDSQVKGYEDKTKTKLTPTEPPTDGGEYTPTEQVEEKGKVEEKVLNIIPSNQKDFQVENIEVDFEIVDKECLTNDAHWGTKLEVVKPSNLKNEKSSTKKEKDLITFSQDVLDCYDECLEYFDVGLHPKEKDVDNWLDTIKKLNRLEHLPFSDIVLLVKSARQDTFWAKNFLSLTKLRRKDKDKIPYWKVFVEKFKQEKTKTEKTYDAYEEARKSMNL
jgi:hypothetical protein